MRAPDQPSAGIRAQQPAPALIPTIRELRAEIDALRVEIAKTRALIAEIRAAQNIRGRQ